MTAPEFGRLVVYRYHRDKFEPLQEGMPRTSG